MLDCCDVEPGSGNGDSGRTCTTAECDKFCDEYEDVASSEYEAALEAKPAESFELFHMSGLSRCVPPGNYSDTDLKSLVQLNCAGPFAGANHTAAACALATAFPGGAACTKMAQATMVLQATLADSGGDECCSLLTDAAPGPQRLRSS